MKTFGRTDLEINDSVEGETIEVKLERIITTREPIEQTTDIIHQERKAGIQPEYDIRTDKMQIAVEGMTAVTNQFLTEREERHKEIEDIKEGEIQNKKSEE